MKDSTRGVDHGCFVLGKDETGHLFPDTLMGGMVVVGGRGNHPFEKKAPRISLAVLREMKIFG